MLIRIRHETIYDYDRPVFIEPMTIRLIPRSDVTQRLIECRIDITPEPEGNSRIIEQDGANAHAVWFGGTHERLVIVTESSVETQRDNPFDYFVTHEPTQHLPAQYPEHLEVALSPYRSNACTDAVRQWAAHAATQSDGLTTAFLRDLTDTMHKSLRVIEREEGDPYPPEKTLADKVGACRDVAMLFIAACRSQGLAARFVSGYSTHHQPQSTHHELHAWAEVYLPGGGWRGYDPSLGLAVADGHIALATGFDHTLAAPVTGSFRGTDVKSTLTYNIDLRVDRQ